MCILFPNASLSDKRDNSILLSSADRYAARGVLQPNVQHDNRLLVGDQTKANRNPNSIISTSNTSKVRLQGVPISVHTAVTYLLHLVFPDLGASEVAHKVWIDNKGALINSPLAVCVQVFVFLMLHTRKTPHNLKS